MLKRMLEIIKGLDNSRHQERVGLIISLQTVADHLRIVGRRYVKIEKFSTFQVSVRVLHDDVTYRSITVGHVAGSHAPLPRPSIERWTTYQVGARVLMMMSHS